MTPKNFIGKLFNRLRAFRTAKDGNVILTFALATIPIVGFVGAAVDYSRGNSAKAAMQSAIDATGLILSKDAQTMTTAELNQKAIEYFNANFNRPEVLSLQINPVFSVTGEGSFKLEVKATGSVPTTFSKIIGQEKMDLSVDTEVRWGIKKLELALALDNTGSMSSSNKMNELKTASITLLDTLKKAAQKAGDVKISIMPFAVDVKIGTGYNNASWVDWTNYGTCSKSQYNYKKDLCQSNGGSWNAGNKSNWNGCVMDRNQPYDTTDTTPATTTTKFPARQCNNSSLESMLPLTDITTGYNSLKNKINAMTPTGNTNVTIGLAWGWHSLTPELPLTDALAPKPDLEKVIILLTDGNNTQNRWSTSQSSIDARMSLACSNVKAANIKIYTVRVINGNATLLRNCATKPEMYYDVQSASQLNNVFSAIAQNLANLRIAK